jgi:uncharacterized membrane protein
MITILKQILIIILAATSLISAILSLLFSFRHLEGIFVTKKTIYPVALLMLTFWISGTLALLISQPEATKVILLISAFLLIVLILYFGITLITLTIFDKSGLRKKYSNKFISKRK